MIVPPRLSRRDLLAAGLGVGSLAGLGGLGGIRPACAGAPAARPSPRLAVLDWGLAASCVALGCGPVGVPAPSWCDRYVGEPVLPSGVVDVGLLFTPNFELLQELRPDLILIPPGLEVMRGPLERVAPVHAVALDRTGPDRLDHVERETRRLAALLGRAAAADVLATRADAALGEARAALAERADRPVWLVNILDERHVNVFGPSSLHHAVLERLGLRNAWDGPPPIGEVATVGLERLCTVPQARVVNIALAGTRRLAAVAATSFWRATPFTQGGRSCEIGSVLGSAGLPAAERLARQLAAALVPVEAARG